MKCILHIGTEKTGSTAIQKWLYDNKNDLSSNKVFLSECLSKPNNRIFSLLFLEDFNLCDFCKRNNISSKEELEAFKLEALNNLKDEILQNSKTHEIFVISSEHLHSRIRKKQEIHNIKEFLSQYFDEIKIICYFREQYEMATSFISTQLSAETYFKSNNFDDVFKNVTPENYYYNFLQIADNWASVFGKNNCIYKIYDKNLFPAKDICRDFINCLNLKNIDKLIGFKEMNIENSSLSYLKCICMNKINLHHPYWNDNGMGQRHLNKLLKNKLSKISSLDKGIVEVDKSISNCVDFKKSNQLFFSKYFSDSTSFRGKRKSEHDT